MRAVPSPAAQPRNGRGLVGLRGGGEAREREMVALRGAGLTLAEIGERFGLTRQRVAQVSDQSDGGRVPTNEVVNARRGARRTAASARAYVRSGEILELWREGLRVGEVAARLGVTWKTVRETLAELATVADLNARKRALSRKRRGHGPQFTDEQLVAQLCAVAERLGRPPTGAEFASAARELGLASVATIHMRFGGWGKALRAAGLEPSAPCPRPRAQQWHLAACWSALVSVADELGDPPRYQRYAQLARERDDLPSASTVRVRLGLWSEIAAALREHNGVVTVAGGEAALSRSPEVAYA